MNTKQIILEAQTILRDIKSGRNKAHRLTTASRWEESSFSTSYTNCDKDLTVFTSWSVDEKFQGMTDGELWICIDGVFLGLFRYL